MHDQTYRELVEHIYAQNMVAITFQLYTETCLQAKQIIAHHSIGFSLTYM